MEMKLKITEQWTQGNHSVEVGLTQGNYGVEVDPWCLVGGQSSLLGQLEIVLVHRHLVIPEQQCIFWSLSYYLALPRDTAFS